MECQVDLRFYYHGIYQDYLCLFPADQFNYLAVVEFYRNFKLDLVALKFKLVASFTPGKYLQPN